MADVCFQKPEVVTSQPMYWDIWPKFGMQVDFDVPKWANWWKPKPEVELWCRGRHLQKWTWRHNSAMDGPIWTKFARQMQNDMPMAMQTWESKPEVEFQHGGRLFSETGCTLCFKKTPPFYFYDDFVRCRPI